MQAQRRGLHVDSIARRFGVSRRTVFRALARRRTSQQMGGCSMTLQTLTDNRALVEQLARLDSGRMRAYRDNLAFYRGQQWAGTQRRRERRLVFNYAKALVDKAASYLMNGVQSVVDPEDGSPRGRRAGASGGTCAARRRTRRTTWRNSTSTARSTPPSWATAPTR